MERTKRRVGLTGLALAMAASACVDSANGGDSGGQLFFPSAIPDAAVVDAGIANDAMAVVPSFDAGGSSFPDANISTLDTGVVIPVEGGVSPDGGLLHEGGTTNQDDGGAEGGTDGGADSGVRAPACTGKPGMKRGKSDQTLMVAGTTRSFVYYAPQGLDPNVPAPIVIVPHGSTMSGQEMYEITRYAEVADREKFIVMFPDGEDGPGSLAPWNVGNVTCGAGGTGLIAIVEASGDDQAFLNAMLKFAEQDQCVDHDHVFMTGFSMGGFLSHETGCLNPAFRGIGPHSGATHDLSSCPNKKMPTIIFHFKNDSLIEYECATGARDQWVKRNGCKAESPDVVSVKGGACEYYKGCPTDGQVALCSFDNDDGSPASPTGHGWSGGSKAGSNPVAAIESTESASELGWAFFKKYAW